MDEGERDYDAELKDQEPTAIDLSRTCEATRIAAILAVHAEYAAMVEVAMTECQTKIHHAQMMRDQSLQKYESKTR